MTYKDDLLAFIQTHYPDDYDKCFDIISDFDNQDKKIKAYKFMSKLKTLYPERADLLKIYQGTL